MPVGALLLKKTKRPKLDPRTELLRVSACLPELNYTALANGTFVIALYFYFEGSKRTVPMLHLLIC